MFSAPPAGPQALGRKLLSANAEKTGDRPGHGANCCRKRRENLEEGIYSWRRNWDWEARDGELPT